MNWIKDTVSSVVGVAGKGIDKIPSENDRANSANELIKNMKKVDLAQAQRFGNQFNPKNPRSWAEAITVVTFGLQMVLILVSSILSIWEIKMDISQNNIALELMFAMLGLGGYRLADKKMGKR